MGTWISHLRIAEQLAAHLPDLDVPIFAIGNLAPDSGAPNADWTQYDPPKEVTHFLRPGQDEGRINDLEFYRAYVAPVAPNDRAYYSFVLGYFCHLVSDNLWAKLIARTTKQAHAALFNQVGDAAWATLKQDWYDLDFVYLRDQPRSLFWQVFLTAPKPPEYLPFLNYAAFCDQIDYIRQFYQAPGERSLDRSYPYLNAATMTRYVNDVTAIMLRVLDAVRATPQTDQTTALALLPPAMYAAYPPPLGDGE